MRLTDFNINVAVQNPERIVCRTAECVFQRFEVVEGWSKKYPVLAFRDGKLIPTYYTREGRLFAGKDSELDLKTVVN